jgi:outer membrane protein N
MLAVSMVLAVITGAVADAASPVTPEAREEASEAAALEKSGDEDPLNAQQSAAEQRAAEQLPGTREAEPNSLELYGSLRVRYRSEVDASGVKHVGFNDGGSRAGFRGRYQFLPQQWLFVRGEAGFNLLDEVKTLLNANANNPDGGQGDSVFRRLLNIGYESPKLFLVLGKTWSTYYQITGFTDRFFGTGGQAAGTYNAGTDGGYTGTGRAENALQTRIRIKHLARGLGLEPFSLNIQLQDGEPIPHLDGYHYGTTLGLSAMLATREHFNAGVAYNRAPIPDAGDPRVRAQGIHGDAEALAVGARWFDDDWYLASVIARLRNHMTTDEHIYFDGWGWEVYGHYRLHGRWWLTGGWNTLRPDGGQPLAGEFRKQCGVLGLRYAVDDFNRVIYINLRGERSLNQDGTGPGNVLTAGIRWGF